MKWTRILTGAIAVACVVALHATRLLDFDLARPRLMSGLDLNWYYYPAFVFTRDALLSGQLPLWNPYQLAGVPFGALHVTMPFYPLLLILLPLPPAAAIAVHGILHIGLCGLFTWLLARRIGLDEAGAAAATLAYGLSYVLAISIFSSANLSNMAWLPAILWALHGLAEKPGVVRALSFAGVVAMSFLSGYAQGFLYSVQVGALYALFLLAAPSTRGRRLAFTVAALLGGLVAAGLSAIQLLPTMELAMRSGRNVGGIPFREAAAYSLNTEMMLRSALGLTQGFSSLPKLVLPLAVAALVLRKHRLQAVFFAGLFLVSWDFLRGYDGWAFHLHYQLPGGNVFRIPPRAAFVYSLSAAMLVGIGLSQITALLGTRRSLVAVLGIVCAAALVADQYPRTATGIRYDPFATPQSLLGPHEIVRFAREEAGYDRIFFERGLFDAVPMKMGSMNRFFVVPDYEPLLPGSYAEVFGIDEIWHGELGVTGSYGRKRRRGDPKERDRFRVSPELLDLFSVRYYLDARVMSVMDPPRDKGSDIAKKVGGVLVKRGRYPTFRRDSAVPRAYVVHEVVPAAAPEAALAIVRDPKSFDPHRQVVLSDAARVEPELQNAKEFARIEQYSLNRVELTVRCESRCIVVLTDLMDPGWQADVDGRAAQILAANYLFRALALEPGRHHVEFRYRPIWFYVGAAISASTLAAVAVLAVWARRRSVAASMSGD